MGAVIFGPSSYQNVLCLTDFLFLLFFYHASVPTALPLELLSANHSQGPICCWYIFIFNLGYHDLDLGNF